MIDHLLESQHRKELSGPGFLSAGEGCLEVHRIHRRGGRLGLVSCTSVSEMECVATMSAKVVEAKKGSL
jgi:hypothetical protein